MKNEVYIKENWGSLTIVEITERLQIQLSEALEMALKLNLHLIDTPSSARRWDIAEENFLTKHSGQLSVREASNLLCRSHYATYQRVKYLGLDEMINKKRR